MICQLRSAGSKMFASGGRLRQLRRLGCESSSLSRCMSSGFATPEGTQAFFMREGADLPLHHQFEVSGLFVNPIIHGPPLRPLSKKKEEVYMLQALSKHKSNAFFVYDHHLSTRPRTGRTASGASSSSRFCVCTFPTV